jgi:hypothetical protein
MLNKYHAFRNPCLQPYVARSHHAFFRESVAIHRRQRRRLREKCPVTAKWSLFSSTTTSHTELRCGSGLDGRSPAA